MAKNKFQLKRTAVSGRAPNTTNSSNTSYIDAGELALNLADGILYSSNGSAAFQIGANLASLTVQNIYANGGIGAAGQVLASGGSGNVYWTNMTGGGGGSFDQNGQYTFTNTISFSNTVTFSNSTSNTIISAANIFMGNTTVFTRIRPGNVNLQGTLLTLQSSDTTNTVSLSSNSFSITDGANTLTVNSSAVVLNGTQFAVFSSNAGSADVANNANYLGGNTAADLQTYANNKAANAYSNAVSYVDGKIATANAAITGNAATAYSNATVYASNATNISSGTLAYARLPANVINTTAAFTFSGIHTYNANVIFGASVIANSSPGTNGQILTSDGANTYWSSKYYVGSLPPDYPNYGDTWYYTDLEKLFMWINDGGSDYWYDFLPPAA